MLLKGNDKNLRNYNFTILDNFDNTLNDFDLVAIGLNEQGISTVILGIYYRTAVITFNDFENRNGNQTTLTVRRYNLYSTDRYIRGIVDRVKIEYGELPGTYKLKNSIKIENLDISMKCLKDNMLKLLSNYKINNTVPRKLINDILDDARKLNLI